MLTQFFFAAIKAIWKTKNLSFDKFIKQFKINLLDPSIISKAESDIYFNREYARPKQK